MFRGEVDPFEHLVSWRSDVQQVTFRLASFALGLIALCKTLRQAVFEGIEILIREVLVVFQQVDAAQPGLVADLCVLLRRETDLRFRYRSERWTVGCVE